MPDGLGRYHLYFAHHTGTYIRMAYADCVQGPWRIHPGGVLSLGQCPFVEGHIASPDVHIDQQNRRFVMYFHGPTQSGQGQTTFAATSVNGLHFEPRSEALGPSYARIFWHDGWWYGLFGTIAISVSRSRDGISGFIKGPVVLPPLRGHISPRHLAVQKCGHLLRVYYTRRGDAPERILHGTIDLAGDWLTWKVQGQTELLRPLTNFEGADLPVTRSRNGLAPGRENALRDPAVFEEDGRTWLFYAVAGESGIALAEIRSTEAEIERRPALTAQSRRLLRRLRRIVSRGLKGGMKPQTRIFIAGCARSGTTLARSLMSCFDDIHVHGQEARYKLFDRLERRGETSLVVKRTGGCHAELADLPASVKLIYCVRHPFDVLTSSHPETVGLRRFHVTTERWEAEYDGLIRLRKVQPERNILILRYEDLIAEPDAAQRNIAGLCELSSKLRFSEDPNNQIRTASLRKWERNEAFRTYLHGLPPEFLARVERFCEEFGYEMPEWHLSPGIEGQAIAARSSPS
ncbi:MAG: sulfotransferase [Mesorhizobium sp.]